MNIIQNPLTIKWLFFTCIFSYSLIFPAENLKIRGLPGFYADSDLGLGYGAILSLADYPENLSNHSYTYKWLLYVEYLNSTKGELEPDILLDLPHLSWKGWQIHNWTKLEYRHILKEPLTAKAEGILPNETTNYENWHYEHRFPYIRNIANLNRIGSKQKVTLGLAFEQHEAFGSPLTEANSNLQLQYPGLFVHRYRDLALIFGWSINTTDFSADPSTGVKLNWINHIYFNWQDHSYAQTYLETALRYRHFISPAKNQVLAWQTVFHQFFSESLPYYQNLRINWDELERGLGGYDTVRGAPLGIISGKRKFYANVEWRLSPSITRWKIGNSSWHSIFVLFVDAGSPLQKDKKAFFYSYGPALRLAWDKDFLISMDYGFSSLNTKSFYLGLNHHF